jgi:hypothetical protein
VSGYPHICFLLSHRFIHLHLADASNQSFLIKDECMDDRLFRPCFISSPSAISLNAPSVSAEGYNLIVISSDALMNPPCHEKGIVSVAARTTDSIAMAATAAP